VAVAIIGLLASVVMFSSHESGQQGRDAKRQADLRALQSAIELYKHKNGSYPPQCVATGPGNDGWSGQIGTNFACDNGSGQYIEGLAPEFISVLPIDPKLNGTNSGYVYRTNSAGTVYKLMAMRTVEGETVDNNHEFKSCDFDSSFTTYGHIQLSGWCINDHNNGGNTRHWCMGSGPAAYAADHLRFRTSYATWGGFAPLSNDYTSIEGVATATQRLIVQYTTDVICQ